MIIDISRKDKAAVLKALYDFAIPISSTQATAQSLPLKRAQELLLQANYFYCLDGRNIKVDFAKDFFDSRLYDEDNGIGAAKRAVDTVPDINK